MSEFQNLYPELLHFLEEERALLVERLWDAPKAQMLALLLKRRPKNTLVITGGARENRLLDDLPFFGITSPLEFPAWETLPTEEIPPSADIVGRRLEILHRFTSEPGPHLVITSLQAVLQKVPAPSLVRSLCTQVAVKQELPFDFFPEFLTSIGFRRVAVVCDKGEFAVRGGIVDLFPPSALQPFRIDFFGDEVTSIRTFDLGTQKSTAKVERLLLTPADERELIEKEAVSLLSYLGNDVNIIFDDVVALEDRYATLKGLHAQNARFFLSFDEVRAQKGLQIYFTKERIEELAEEVKIERRDSTFQEIEFPLFGKELRCRRWLHPFIEPATYFSTLENRAAWNLDELLTSLERMKREPWQVFFLASSQAEERFLRSKLAEKPLSVKHSVERGYLSSGFVLPQAHIALIPMTELTGRLRTRREKWRTVATAPLVAFHELIPGDLVVHYHYGIGRYCGSEKRKDHLGEEREFLTIEYAEKSKLYVPISQAHLVSRYIGMQEETPSFSVLGTNRWKKTVQLAEKAVVGYAQELLRRNAEREVEGGFTFPSDTDEMAAFEAEFPFEETPDQLSAIQDLKGDMASPKAMDRLLCGDVGFGKTEVAMRAAFKAVREGKKQVAVLVPTTVLALQHFETFSARMANFPVRIAALSRFVETKACKKLVEKLESGEIDILISTHRMLTLDFKFKDLGLVVIDEEQRFGVRAKEKLKALKSGVDCLTLSATPIPRTLYLSIMGARDISVISTPPFDRLPIKVMLMERTKDLLMNALSRELARDGQAFVIHNRVESIFGVAEEIQKLIPQARVAVAHGSMESEEIDTVFHAFKQGEVDILVATTIVENGIDIPNANTILIDRADTFGLADLYQLRGRVGRWNRTAYAYFMVPKQQQLSDISRRRLEALLESGGLGGGMRIAMRDLEIRGAGDILGVQQSGQVAQIGFHLYCKLLKRTVEAMKQNREAVFTETKLETPYPAFLPDSYISDSSVRMEIYHRLGDATSQEELAQIFDEIQDRFGAAPPAVHWLYRMARVRRLASTLHIASLRITPTSLVIEKESGKTHTFTLKRQEKPEAVEKEIFAVLAHL